MSDNNFNGYDSDDTAALFVSTQKKKAAEEAARKKAEEEQARLAAAEAEARRMEQEVEERKRRAQEEAMALEQAERELAEQKARKAEAPVPEEKPKAAKAKPKPKPEKQPVEKPAGPSNPKLPIYIGAGVAAVVLIIIIAVVLGGKKGGSASSESVAQMETSQLNDEFNTEYVSKEDGYDLKFMYPAGMYTDVTEEKTDGEITIHFGPQDSGMIDTDIVITDYKWDNKDSFIMDYNACMCSVDDFQKGFTEKITNKSKELIPDITVKDEKIADVKDEGTDRYSYKCSFTSSEKGNGAISAWVGINSKGECKRVVVCCRNKDENTDGCKKLADTFTDKYAGETLLLPGNNPPKSTETDGVLDVDEMHMGIIVPKDLFVKYDSEGANYSRFTDRNGAQVIVQGVETEVDLTGETDAVVSRDQMHEAYKNVAQVGINDYFGGVDSRMFLDEAYDSLDTRVDYTANYKDMIGGITYWERDRIGYWTDVRTKKHYIYVLITLVPEKDQDVYKQIFDRSLDMLKDI